MGNETMLSDLVLITWSYDNPYCDIADNTRYIQKNKTMFSVKIDSVTNQKLATLQCLMST